MDFNQIMPTVTTIVLAFGWKFIGAIVVWVVGRYLIGLAVRLVHSAQQDSQFGNSTWPFATKRVTG